MKIYFNSTELDLPVNDNSYRYRAIRGEHSLTLYYSLAEHVEIPVGAYCEFEGETYTLERPENFRMLNTRNFEYTLVMDSRQTQLGKYKFKDTTSRSLKFSLTARPETHLKMLVDNLNMRDEGWTVGSYIDAVEKVISYNHAYCLDALNQIANSFETEWEIVGKTIHLRKVEYNKENPLSLSYGRGNGFKSGIGRSTGNSRPVEILYVQGSERNIDTSKYGSRELLLPKNRRLIYEGREYISDSDGFSIRRFGKTLQTFAEDSLDCSHIYPSRVGTISSVIEVDAAKHFYDFKDKDIPANLNFGDCLIEGETMTVIFQSGILTGKEFEVKYVHAERRFKLVPQELDGRTMPDDVFCPKVGDTYAVFGMMLPNAYICDNATKSGASWDMFREAAKYMYENEEQKFTFTGELDGIWAKKDWLNIGGKIKLGGYILFSDNQFQPDGVLIRIVGIKDYINNPHSPSIELSNEVTGSSLISELRKIESNEVTVDELHREALRFTKRRYRDSIETINMIEAALFGYFTNAIQPVAVRTMSMLAGDESLQFRFVDSETDPVEEVAHNVVWDMGTKTLTSPAGIIQHLTLGIDTVSSSHAADEYKVWVVEDFVSPTLTDGEKKYYLYAKVSETDNTGEFILSENPVEMEGVSGYYHLLVGVLNSEYDGERSYVSLYGFTEVLPGQLTTNKVVSADGNNFIDFLNNAVRIGNDNTYLDFNTSSDGQLRLKGTIVQSPSGDNHPLGCFRGEYDSTKTYYKGDEVTYQGSTYLYNNDTAEKGKLPTNTSYWGIVAAKGGKGDKGDKGNKGAVPVYRGEYDSTETYYGTDGRMDIVQYNKTYYIARSDAGDGFTNKLPTNTSYWTPFGAQFESVATNLLLAEMASIGNWTIKDNRITSTRGMLFKNLEYRDVATKDIIEGDIFFPYAQLDGFAGRVKIFSTKKDKLLETRLDRDGLSVEHNSVPVVTADWLGLEIEAKEGKPTGNSGLDKAVLIAKDDTPKRQPTGLFDDPPEVTSAIYGRSNLGTSSYGGYFDKLHIDSLFTRSTGVGPGGRLQLDSESPLLVFGSGDGSGEGEVILPEDLGIAERQVFIISHFGAGTTKVTGNAFFWRNSEPEELILGPSRGVYSVMVVHLLWGVWHVITLD
jgi:hypothetical protein